VGQKLKLKKPKDFIHSHKVGNEKILASSKYNKGVDR
jgi:hypothetical protein